MSSRKRFAAVTALITVALALFVGVRRAQGPDDLGTARES